MGVGLPIRLQRRRSTRGDECVLGDDILGPGDFGVVDDVGRVGVRGQQGPQDLGVEAAPRDDRDARPDRVPCQLVAEANVAASTSSSCRRSGSTAAAVQPGITASNKDALTRVGTTETSSTRRRAAASSRAARPSTAFATEGGGSAPVREPNSSVT